MSEENQPEFIALGTGTCVSGLGWEKKERWPPGYLLKGLTPELILIEASEGVRYRINQYGEEYMNVGDVFISHLHPDHFNLVPLVQSIAIKQFWSQGKFERDSLRIYGPTGIEKAFWRIWEIKVREHRGSIYNLVNLEFVELSDQHEVKLHNLTLVPYKVFHAYGKITSFALRLETPEGVFTYSGDSAPDNALKSAAENSDVFLCESSADIGVDKSEESGHLNPTQAGNLAKDAGVDNLWFTHYSGKDSPQAIINKCRESGFGGGIKVLRDGDRLTLFEKDAK